MSKGNGGAGKEDLALLMRVQEKVQRKTITCAQASALAEELKITKAKIGKALDELEVKITKCQLGCF